MWPLWPHLKPDVIVCVCVRACVCACSFWCWTALTNYTFISIETSWPLTSVERFRFTSTNGSNIERYMSHTHTCHPCWGYSCYRDVVFSCHYIPKTVSLQHLLSSSTFISTHLSANDAFIDVANSVCLSIYFWMQDAVASVMKLTALTQW